MTRTARAAPPALHLVLPAPAATVEPVADGDWQASLELGFERRAAGTFLARCRHHGPLRVQKALYPEGPDLAHAIVLHPPAGIAGGDRLEIACSAATGAAALLTTPGAGKWYRGGGRLASQDVRIDIAAGACVEWLPQETIFFAGADARLSTTIDLTGDACWLGVETLCFGRAAAGERFDCGTLTLRTQVRRDGRLLWHENARLAGGSDWLAAAPGLAGHPVCSTLLLAVPELASAPDPELLAACREAALATGLRAGLTALPGLLVARCLCAEAEQARHWFVGLWTLLRPALLGRAAVVPRIWRT